ncbi:MAG: transketolase, partial [Euryarchaeota archaeon]|nr:transketolase [Euryarchaeota archaeon]
YKLDNVTAFVDRNRLQIDGPTEEVMSVEPLAKKWEGFGWHVIEIDGHNLRQILDACGAAERVKGKPTVIIARTIKGKGVSYMENSIAFHGKAPNEQELRQGLRELGEDA